MSNLGFCIRWDRSWTLKLLFSHKYICVYMFMPISLLTAFSLPFTSNWPLLQYIHWIVFVSQKLHQSLVPWKEDTAWPKFFPRQILNEQNELNQKKRSQLIPILELLWRLTRSQIDKELKTIGAIPSLPTDIHTYIREIFVLAWYIYFYDDFKDSQLLYTYVG